MENIETKKIIAKLLHEGNTLSEVQKILQSEHDLSMTFLDLRLLASELEGIDWTQGEEPVETIEEKKKKQEESDAKMAGKTVVDVSKIQRPGIALSGSVKFASGALADWILDQTGQLGFEKSDGEPTPEDIQEFQVELQKSLGR